MCVFQYDVQEEEQIAIEAGAVEQPLAGTVAVAKEVTWPYFRETMWPHITSKLNTKETYTHAHVALAASQLYGTEGSCSVAVTLRRGHDHWSMTRAKHSCTVASK